MTFRRGRRPDPNDNDAANLSEDDVERRLGGGAGLGGPVPERPAPPVPAVAPRPATPPPDSPTMVFKGGGGRGGGRGGVLWRDVGLVLVLLVFLAVGARVVLPDNSTAVATPSPGASAVAVASPTAVPTASPTPLASPSPTAEPLPTDVIPSQPEPTATAGPTPTPTATPRTTPAPTPQPTPTTKPPTATLTISFLIINEFGGNDKPSSWTVHVTGAGASPSTYSGVSSTTVSVNAGQAYSVGTTASTPGGYGQGLSDDCSGTLLANQSAQCTITETEIEPKLEVFVSGLPDASMTTVTVSGANASVPSFAGSASGTNLRVYANASYSITASAVTGYSQSSTYGTCSGPLREGASVQCILYFTASAAAVPIGDATAAILRAAPF